MMQPAEGGARSFPVFAEMATGSILFAGDSDIGQLFKIFDLLGTPGPGKPVPWKGVQTLPYFNESFPAMRPKDLKAHPSTAELCACTEAEDLLRRMLAFDPLERITAVDALRHPFLSGGLGSPAPPVRTMRRSSLLFTDTPTRSPLGGLGCTSDDPVPDDLCVWDGWRTVETQQWARVHERLARSRRSAEDMTLRWFGDGPSRQLRRERAVLWMLRVSIEFCRCDRTLHLAVSVLDAVLNSRCPPPAGLFNDDAGTASAQTSTSSNSSPTAWTELIAVGALLLACKFQEASRFPGQPRPCDPPCSRHVAATWPPRGCHVTDRWRFIC